MPAHIWKNIITVYKQFPDQTKICRRLTITKTQLYNKLREFGDETLFKDPVNTTSAKYAYLQSNRRQFFCIIYMLQITAKHNIFIAVQAVDFRCGIDSLSAYCKKILALDPLAGHVFVFRNNKANSIKILYYDSQGFWLCLNA